MKRVWINPLYDIYVCPEKNVCFCNLTINKKLSTPPFQKKSQEVAEIKGALHPMHWGVIGDRRKIVGIHNKYLTRENTRCTKHGRQ